MKEIKATDECRHELGYKLMRPIVSWNFKRKYHPVVIGGENIPKTGPLVFCGNHRHKDDQYNVMLETKRVIHMLSKDEYFKGKSAWFYRAAGCIPVDRSIHDENAKSEARAILHSKGCIGLFPEGTRNEVTCKDEELEKVKLDKSESKIKIINQTIDLLKKDKEKEREEYIDKLIEEAIAESKIVLKKDINNNEFKNHLRKSMEKLGSLIIRGLDIVPALKAKPEIKQLSLKATANIEEKRKLIIGIDNLKYLTILDTDVKSKDIPADTAELPE